MSLSLVSAMKQEMEGGTNIVSLITYQFVYVMTVQPPLPGGPAFFLSRYPLASPKICSAAGLKGRVHPKI